jgi:hypothetical protein
MVLSDQRITKSREELERVQLDARAGSPSRVPTWGFAFTTQYDEVGPQSVVHVTEEVGITGSFALFRSR